MQNVSKLTAHDSSTLVTQTRRYWSFSLELAWISCVMTSHQAKLTISLSLLRFSGMALNGKHVSMRWYRGLKQAALHSTQHPGHHGQKRPPCAKIVPGDLTVGDRLRSLGEIKLKGGSSVRQMWQEVYQSHTNRLNLKMTQDFETHWQSRLEFQMQNSWTN